MIEIDRNGQRLRLKGELTIYYAAELKQPLLDHLQSPGDAEIELEQVNELDSAGLQLLLLAKREAVQAGKRLRLLSHSPAVLEVLETFDLVGYFGDPVVLSSQRTKTA